MAYNLMQKKENLEFIKTEHVSYLDSYGFKININGKKVVYTGDTNTLLPFESSLNDADEFYIDISKYGGAHLKIDDVIEELKAIANKNTNIFLMHLDDKEYIEKYIGKNIFLA